MVVEFLQMDLGGDSDITPGIDLLRFADTLFNKRFSDPLCAPGIGGQDSSDRRILAAHTGRLWRVGFCGFAPGFAYLVGGDERLAVPRRAEPRTKVPVGSVGLAGEFTGVYPRESPGGWQLIGRTSAVMWDVHRKDPALLTPGMWVRFQAASSDTAEVTS